MTGFKPKAAAISEAALKRSVAVVGVLAYPSIAAVDENGKYSTLLIIDKDEPTLADLRELVGDLAAATFGDRKIGARHHDPIRSGDEPSRDGAGFAFKNEAFRNKIVVRLKSGFEPKVVAGPRREKMDAGQVKGGDHVVAEISGFGFNNQSAGVGLSLSSIWWLKPGDVVIEKGGAAGASFAKFDASKLKFATPSDMIRPSDSE